ncbi:MAG: CBS domain-containing protein [Kofleriaceae bacterium]|nr:CBS domain-containing protein [Myxococcales bacterium]MCB9571836.1 CBS domain-containing protein [Kofleriaceae bacterium]
MNTPRTNVAHGRTLTARDLMQRDPVTVPGDTPLLVVQHMMVAAEIDGVPIVDADGRVCGIVARADLLRAIDQACDQDVDAGPHGPEPGDGDLIGYLGALTAADVAAPDVTWTTPETPASEVARLMRERGLHRVLVGTAPRLAGILTSFDLLRLAEARS